MNASDQQVYNQALSLSSTGYKSKAYNLLVNLYNSNQNQNDVNILIALAYTAPDVEEARTTLQQAALLAPGNPEIDRARNWLTTQRTVQPKPPTYLQSSQQITMNQNAPVYAQHYSTPQKRGMSSGLKWGIALVVLTFVAIIAVVIISGTGVFDKDEAQSTLTTFMSAAAAGNAAAAYDLVLPTITQEQLQTAFLTPDANNLRDYANMQITSSQFFQLPGGNSFLFRGVVNYKTLGKSTFEAQVQRVDDDEKWYVVSIQLSAPGR